MTLKKIFIILLSIIILIIAVMSWLEEKMSAPQSSVSSSTNNIPATTNGNIFLPQSVALNNPASVPIATSSGLPLAPKDTNLTNVDPLSIDKKVIRPIIQDILQKKYQNNDAQKQTAILGAAILQTYLNSPNPTDAAKLLNIYDCSVIALNQEDQNFIKAMTFDTPARLQQLELGKKSLPLPISTQIVIKQGNAISPCQNSKPAILSN